MINKFLYIRKRRQVLFNSVDVNNNFKEWEESCIPSYCHPNWLAAYISWWRLFKAVDLAHRHVGNLNEYIKALDFGSSVGELGHLIAKWEYHFIEIHDRAAGQLLTSLPHAFRHRIEFLENNKFDIIFALDSLEHNADYEELIEKLYRSLKSGGLLILSGPTENSLYKLGRRISGFDGDYHQTNIFKLEEYISHLMDRVSLKCVPILIPLFRISAWRKL